MTDKHISHDMTSLSDNEVKTLRRATRIVARLERQTIRSNTNISIDYYLTGLQIDKIILAHTVGSPSPHLEP